MPDRSTGNTASRARYLKAAAFLVLAAAAAYALFFTPLGAKALSPEGRRELVAGIDRAVRAAGPLGPALFVLIYGLGAQVMPATPLTAAGSIVFGKYAGAICNQLGAMLGAALSFVLGRYFLRDLARGLLVGKLAELDRKAAEHGFSIVFYMRILLFPFIVLNYAAGATGIRFRDYFWATFFGILPSIIITSVFFGSLRDIVASWRGPRDLLQPAVLVPAVLLVLSFFIPAAVRRFRKGSAAAPGGRG